MERNWAGNVVYGAERIARPTTVAELRDVVAGSERVRALGTRHSFNDLTDTSGVLVSVAELPADVEIDATARTVRVAAGVRYGALAVVLEERGWALSNLASLPHISVGGAIATGTHGSGDANGSLAAAVAGLELVGADGAIRSLARGHDEFAGSVVALGALGVLTHVTLDIVPTFQLRQTVFPTLPATTVFADLDAVFASGHSVSVFTTWGEQVQVWVKSVDPVDLYGTAPASEPVHMVRGEPAHAVTEQGGVPGSWLARLPHFRLNHNPSVGHELQTEYLLPREHAGTAVSRLRALARRLSPLLLVSELRTVAADDLWLSGAYGRDALAVHFTWRQDPESLNAVLPDLEAALLPLDARAHWGKCFTTPGHYPRWTDFVELVGDHDPHGKFGNAFLTRLTAVRP